MRESSKPIHHVVISIVLTPAFLVRFSLVVFFLLSAVLWSYVALSVLVLHTRTSQPVYFIPISFLRFCLSSQGLVVNIGSLCIEWRFSPIPTPAAVQTCVFVVYLSIDLCITNNGPQKVYRCLDPCSFQLCSFAFVQLVADPLAFGRSVRAPTTIENVRKDTHLLSVLFLPILRGLTISRAP